MTKRGKMTVTVMGLVFIALLLTGWANSGTRAIETRPEIPPETSSEGSSGGTGSQIIYELAPGFQAKEAQARGAEGARRLNIIGIAAWGIIGAGVLVVVVVVIVGSRKKVGAGGVKRTRYRRKLEAETRARRYMDDNRYRKY